MSWFLLMGGEPGLTMCLLSQEWLGSDGSGCAPSYQLWDSRSFLLRVPGVLLGWPLASRLACRHTWVLQNHGREGCFSISSGPPPYHILRLHSEISRKGDHLLPCSAWGSPSLFQLPNSLILPRSVGPGLHPTKMGEGRMALSRDCVICITRKQR